MALTQLNPQIPLKTEKGNGQAIAVIDYSEEHDLIWVVVLDDSGEIWSMPNAKVRAFPNYTAGRKGDSSISQDVAAVWVEVARDMQAIGQVSLADAYLARSRGGAE